MAAMSDGVKMWLDDVRDPDRHGHIGWTWVKSFEEAVSLLKTGKVVRASLDHDLTPEQSAGLSDSYGTGYDVVCWMEANNCWPTGGTKCHSMNPLGRRRIEKIIGRNMGAK